MALNISQYLVCVFCTPYVLLLIFSEARAVHESEILYQFLRQSSHSENNSYNQTIDRLSETDFYEHKKRATAHKVWFSSH